ncbi:hypothetical protein Ga0609869_000219 [Rhodovulum iodosum]|uniref:Uncharacterized protein n=1 Tax=Rhodovulum iodosum TaxID=68291 RepID=A0ABV3XNI0_9RHOB|nr:hypothetical protein [Rhodovulum robiginosum]RSK34768.1 hypothetical protein EJA01_07365 [Rhodovulum robiginosum]
MSEVLARLNVAAPRRYFGLAMLLALAGVALYVAFSTPSAAIGLQLFLLAVGGGALWLSVAMHRATARDLRLTDEGLFDSEGRVLALLDDIEAVERGMFAMKPSNGFVLRLKTPGTRAWAPGVWWRLGRHVGVGGVTAAGQGKAMSEILMLALSERRAP